MSAWKAVFDRVVIDRLPGGMRNLKVIADSITVYDRVLSSEEAAHLASLLQDAPLPPQG